MPPFVKRGKTDAVDAEAISEAVTRKTMRFVPVKTAEQQAAAMMLKTRALLVRQRTQAVNAMRAHLTELGIIAGAGIAKIDLLIAIVRDEADGRLPPAARFALTAIADQIATLSSSAQRRCFATQIRTRRAMPWLTGIVARRPYKVAAVALANKMARIVWAVLNRGGVYQRQNSLAADTVTA